MSDPLRPSAHSTRNRLALSEDSERAWRRLLIRGGGALVLVCVVVVFGCWWYMVRSPGESFVGEPATLGEKQLTVAEQLRADVVHLATTIGERNLDNYPRLNEAADYIEAELESLRYQVRRDEFTARGLACFNIEAERLGSETPNEIVVIGAHYDSVVGSPGANDNASGTAALLALARAFQESKPDRTLRFVAFTNEEPPYFQGKDMGSYVYAKRCREKDEDLVAVLSLETMGYFTDEPNSQSYPGPIAAFYPSTGNFIGVVGNVGSRPLVHRVVESFRRHAEFPSEAGAMPGDMQGVGWSDHWSFWQADYQAVMITDTAPFRYPHYHLTSDTPEKLDYEAMVRIIDGLTGVINELVTIDSE